MKSGVSFFGDRRIVTRAGELKHIFTKSVPELDATGKIIMLNGVVLDVTDRKKSEIAVAQNFKMSALGEMAGGVAHEINSPLTVIKIVSEELVEHVEKGTLDRDFILKMSKKVGLVTDRIAKIISGLRHFSRDGTHDPVVLASLRQICDETHSLCSQNLVLRKINFQISVPKDIQIECRSVEISQVLLNLINNSSDAIATLSEKWISVSAILIEDSVEIRVTDSGKGIPDAIAEKLYQPFFTTKDVGKGTGLGLSLSKGIIDSHKGKITLDVLCSNTCFVVSLPRVQPKIGAKAA